MLGQLRLNGRFEMEWLKRDWWLEADSNCRPEGYESSALTN